MVSTNGFPSIISSEILSKEENGKGGLPTSNKVAPNNVLKWQNGPTGLVLFEAPILPNHKFQLHQSQPILCVLSISHTWNFWQTQVRHLDGICDLSFRLSCINLHVGLCPMKVLYSISWIRLKTSCNSEGKLPQLWESTIQIPWRKP